MAGIRGNEWASECWDVLSTKWRPLIQGHKFIGLPTPRQLEDDEHAIIAGLLRHAGRFQSALESQLPYSRVAEECASCPSIRLGVDKVPGVVPALGAERVVAEGFTLPKHETGGIRLLLHVGDDGYMVELELYREDGGAVSQLPPIESIDFDPYGPDQSAKLLEG